MSSVVTLWGGQEVNDLPDTAPVQVNWLMPKQRVGIEIEVERGDGVSLASDMDYWQTKSDGSLRSGVEFVLSGPMRGERLSAAISEFFLHNRTVASPTSGTHIHLDMRDSKSTYSVCKTMAYIVTCMEPAIFALFADGREWCGYTNTLDSLPCEAQGVLFSEQEDAANFATLFNPRGREYKYYGFNLMPLGRYGSVEFRYFNTATSGEELVEWIQFCMAVKNAAIEVNIPRELKRWVSTESLWQEFLSVYFAPWKDRILASMSHRDVLNRYKEAKASGALRQNGLLDKKYNFKNTKFKRLVATRVVNNDGSEIVIHSVDDLGEFGLFSPSSPVMLYETDYIHAENIPDNSVLLVGSSLYIRNGGEWRPLADARTVGNNRWGRVERMRAFTLANSMAAVNLIATRAAYGTEITPAMRGVGYLAPTGNPQVKNALLCANALCQDAGIPPPRLITNMLEAYNAAGTNASPNVPLRARATFSTGAVYESLSSADDTHSE